MLNDAQWCPVYAVGQSDAFNDEHNEVTPGVILSNDLKTNSSALPLH